MHSIVALLSLLAFGTSVTAAPVPQHLNARAVPHLHEVARDPAPIDGIKLVTDVLDTVIKTPTSSTTWGKRGVPKVESEIVQPGDVVGKRATPRVESTIAQPGTVVGSA